MSLSLDLRGRVLEAYENKEGSIRSISKRFKIGTTTIVSWLKRKRRLGIITPGKSTGRPKGLQFLAKSLEKNNELTLKALAESYEKKYGPPLERPNPSS